MHIRRYAHEDYPKVLDLIRVVYNEDISRKAAQRFQWQYEQNPNNSPDDPLILVIVHKESLIGMVGTFPQKVKIGNSVHRSYWIGDYMLRPDSRLGFRAIGLAKKFRELPFLVMGFPAETSIKIWLRLGGLPFSQLLRFSRIIPKASDKPADQWGDFIRRRILRGIKILEITQFDERFDLLWAKASKNYHALQVRDSSFLNWRFTKCPYIAYRILTAVKGNAVLGYIVLREHQKDGVLEGGIVDLFTDRTDQYITEVLLAEAVKTFKNRGYLVVKITVSATDIFLADILKKFDFDHCEKIDRGLLYNNANFELNLTDNEHHNWFITRADSDMDFTE